MTLGYVSRPFFKMEALLYPVYNSVLKVLLPDALFEVRLRLNACSLERLKIAYNSCKFSCFAWLMQNSQNTEL